MFADMEEKLLYPRFPIMHIWFYEDGSREYPLSRILATWGYVIRYISFERGMVIVLCYTGDEEKRYGKVELRIPIADDVVAYKRPYDLIVKYDLKEGELVNPVCVSVLSMQKAQ